MRQRHRRSAAYEARRLVPPQSLNLRPEGKPDYMDKMVCVPPQNFCRWGLSARWVTRWIETGVRILDGTKKIRDEQSRNL